MKQDDPLSSLMFRWRASEGVTMRLFLYTLLAVVTFVAFLLLFEVVYPAPSRRPHTMQRITLLDPAQPKAREMVAAVTDRNFMLLTPGPNAAPRLADLGPVFSPGFKDYQLQVKDLPETGAVSSTLPRLFGPDHAPLPPVTKPRLAAKPVGQVRSRLVAVAADGLEKRPIVHDVEQLPEGSPALAELNARFRVAVAPDGRVLTAASLMDEGAESSAAVSRAFRQIIDQMRFSPVPTPGPQWGTLTFRWKKEAGS